MNFSTLKKSLLLVAMAFLFTISATAQKNNVLIEQFTGSWCGWCPLGGYSIDTLLKKYPDAIWVTVHNADPMKIPTCDTLEQLSSVTGFPSAAVNRAKGANNKIAQGTTNTFTQEFKQVFDAQRQLPVRADVKVTNVVYNKATRKITATVEVTMLQSLQGNYNINMYIIEDEVTGPNGSKYDQSNYLANRAGYEKNPYYNKPSVIAGYKHRNVLRSALGGANGIAGVIGANPQSGQKFTQEFTYTLPAGFNDANVWLAGFMQNGSGAASKDIINAEKKPLLEGSRITANIATVTNYGKVPANADFKSQVEVTNPNPNSITVNLSVNTANSTIPSSWNVSVNPAILTIPAGGKANADISIKSDALAAFAKINVTCMPQVSGGIVGIETSTDYFALSESAKNVVFTGMQVEDAVNVAYYTNLISKTKYKNNTIMLPLSEEVLTNYSLSGFDLMILPMDFANSRDKFLSNADLANGLKDAMMAGKRVIISGEISAYNTFSANGSPAVKALLTDMFGMNAVGTPIQRVTLNTSGQITAINSFKVNGVSGDELGNGLTLTTNTPTQAFPYYNIYTDALKIDNSGTGKAFMTYENSSLIGGVRAQKGDSRGIYLSFSPEAIPSAAARNAFINKIIDWVTAAVTPTADIAVLGDNGGETVDFGDVGLNKTVSKTFDIKNTGKADLVISEFTWDESMPGWFKLGGNVTFPLTVAPGTTKTLTIECTAKALDDQISYCTIKSNATSGEKNLGLILRGVKVSSVELGTSGNGMLSVSAGPNPFTESTKVNYTVGGETPQVVTVSVIDALGNTVATLANSIMGPGTYNASLNGATLAAGAYRVVVTSGVTSTYVPVMLVK